MCRSKDEFSDHSPLLNNCLLFYYFPTRLSNSLTQTVPTLFSYDIKHFLEDCTNLILIFTSKSTPSWFRKTSIHPEQSPITHSRSLCAYRRGYGTVLLQPHTHSHSCPRHIQYILPLKVTQKQSARHRKLVTPCRQRKGQSTPVFFNRRYDIYRYS